MTIRTWVQGVTAVLTNAWLKGFVSGNIYDGPIKHVCVPTLNCYSCPGALFACPVGAVQVVLSAGGGLDPTAIHTWRDKLLNMLSGTPLLVIGLLTAVGALVGRASCGWACPFGWLQDLAQRVPGPKWTAPRFLRFGRYLVLLVLVILMPLFWVDAMGYSDPAFCKYLCPAGTLEGGILLPLLKPELRALLGKLFAWKLSILVFFLLAMVVWRRPFCSWACPLGAFLGPFNRVSAVRLEFDADACVHCGRCSKVCPSGLDVEKELDTAECVRCLECVEVCPKHLIRVRVPLVKPGTGPVLSPSSQGDSPAPGSPSPS
jgi:polyferredoxin